MEKDRQNIHALSPLGIFEGQEDLFPVEGTGLVLPNASFGAVSGSDKAGIDEDTSSWPTDSRSSP